MLEIIDDDEGVDRVEEGVEERGFDESGEGGVEEEEIDESELRSGS